MDDGGWSEEASLASRSLARFFVSRSTHLISGKTAVAVASSPGSRVSIDSLSSRFCSFSATTPRKRCARVSRSRLVLARPLLQPTHPAPRLSRVLLSSPWHAISSTPPATRAFTVILVTLSAANSYFKYSTQIDVPYIPYLTLVPGDFIFYPWTLLSAGFVETHFFEVGICRLSSPTHATLADLVFLTPPHSPPYSFSSY